MVELDRIINGDCLDAMRTLPDASVDCCITSPPYYGLRDYGIEGQIGLEQTPEAYVARLVEVFREVRRVLKPEGTLWLNLGDSFASGKGTCFNPGGVSSSLGKNRKEAGAHPLDRGNISDLKASGLKPKDLIGIPWMVAFALRADGWYLRSDIIWAKGNPMPESVTDRPTKSHEYIFLLSKSQRYFYDSEAIKEPSVSDHPSGNGYKRSARLSYLDKNGSRGNESQWQVCPSRNKRSVWNINTKPYKEAHFATFPESLVEPCILAGTSERGYCPDCGKPWVRQVEHKNMVIRKSDRMADMGEFGRTQSSGTMLSSAETKTIGWLPSCQCASEPRPGVVLDPFSGAGAVALVAKKLGRHYIGIELNPDYISMANARVQKIPVNLRAFEEDARP